MKRLVPCWLGCWLGGAVAMAAAASAPSPASPAPPAPTRLPAYLVTATRMAQLPEQTASVVDTFTIETLARSPALTLDETLRASAAFSLFRRSSSLMAHPTAQGVSLRGLGPSGASRSLVLLDGIPLNDPFGGWITWGKIPRLTLQRAEIVRGTGSGVWGNAALGGTVQLFASNPAEEPGGAVSLEAGGLGTVRGEFVARSRRRGEAPSGWQLGGRWFRTDGPWQYRSAQRGAIDRRLDAEHALLHGEYATRLGSGLRLTLGGRWFDEDRGNGTPLQRNRSRENAGHARLGGELRPGLELDVLAYGQRQHFASSFSAVSSDRASETPALDQFDVPATAWGGAILTTWKHAADASTVFGADGRSVSGETRENFFFAAGEFQRRRVAGGQQLIGGVFAAHQQPWGDALSLQAAARIDTWSLREGHRREWVQATGAVLRDERFPARSSSALSPSVGLVWRPAAPWTWRGTVYRAFRIPTLNELHRPFRVGDVATEANPALRREVVTGGELGAEFRRAAWQARASVFENQLRDGVANVTLSTTPTLTQRQRHNLDLIRVRGFEAGLAWNAGATLAVALDFLLLDARVNKATVAPDLAGRRLAQVPRHTATLAIGWEPHQAWRCDAALRAVSAQYEDDENTLRLDPFVTMDLAVRHAITSRQSLHLAVENIFDARIETSRTGSGLVALGSRRTARAGWSVTW